MLTKGRLTYKPFIYEKAHDYWLKQQQAHWLPQEAQMGPDVQDWKLKLTPEEKNVVAGVLKGFIQTEVIVNDYWSGKVAQWFKHPEVSMMASCFGAVEGIHMIAYAFLNDTLGLTDYNAFLQEPTAKAKIDRLLDVNTNSPSDPHGDPFVLDDPLKKHAIARSLAVFSAFTEGVSLFSAFAILLNFSRFNKLKGVGTIVSWSCLDEALHSEAGCWLFREFIKENPEMWTDELKKELYQAARDTISIEDDFIDKVFEMGSVEGLDPKDLKQFIRHRANVKLGDLGLKTNWRNIDQEALQRLTWFDMISKGLSQQDFFSTRETNYSKASIDLDGIFE